MNFKTLSKYDHFTLAHFEGSLDFLLCLIQKQELGIIDIPIQEIIHQFIEQLNNHQEELDQGAEFIKNAAYLMWLKSQMLLPCQHLENEEESEDLQVMDHLVDYCLFKQAAKTLTLRQEQQQACYFRGIETIEGRKPLGIDHISLEELSLLFKEIMRTQDKILIQEEHWRLSDKLHIIRCLLQEQSSLPFSSLFSTAQSRLEMIVIFLAVLELMKTGELYVGREQTSVLIFTKE